MNLIVAAQPRSCSTWLMNQIRQSPILSVCSDRYGELIINGNRGHTRKLLGLPPIDNPDVWSGDIEYTERFFKKHPNGCFKLLAHVHGAEYHNFIANSGVPLVVLRREDIASAMASHIAAVLKRAQTGEDGFDHPSRTERVTYTDLQKLILNTLPGRSNRERGLELFYYTGQVKCQTWLSYLAASSNTVLNITTETMRENLSVLEDLAEIKIDYTSLLPVSHYSEIFIDWKEYENDVRSILGNIAGI